MSLLGTRLALLMERQGLSQADLARISGISQPQISRLLRTSDTAPRTLTVRRLASALGVQPDVLTGDERMPDDSDPSLRQHFKAAVQHLAATGFTDVLPAPMEQQLFEGDPDDVVELLLRIDALFSPDAGAVHPHLEVPRATLVAAPKGRWGFRWVSQIDPLYDAYALGLLLSEAESIEAERMPVEKQNVFSYRYDPSPFGVLWADAGMDAFIRRSKELVCEYPWVVTTDIADFYSRIPIGRVGERLRDACTRPDTARKLTRLYEAFAGPTGVGLPIGGPAARLVAELFLAPIDEILDAEGIRFVRFVDDYHLFAPTAAEAHSALIRLGELLHELGAITLQPTKTTLDSGEKFLKRLDRRYALDEPDQELRLSFDMYGDVEGEEEYLDWTPEEVRAHFDRCLAHDDALGRRTLGLMPWLNDASLEAAVQVVLTRIVIPSLRSLIPHALRHLAGQTARLTPRTKEQVASVITAMFLRDDPLVQIDQVALLTVDLLRNLHADSGRKIVLALAKRRPNNDLLQAHVARAMFEWEQMAWIRERLEEFNVCGPWLRRVLIAASYHVGPAGARWRGEHSSSFTLFEQLVNYSAAKAVR